MTAMEYLVRCISPSDKPATFEEVTGLVLNAVIPIAIGTTEAGEPNIVGTGFSAEFTEIVVTCWHVAVEEDKLIAANAAKLRKLKLKDAKFRVGIRMPDASYQWFEHTDGGAFRFGVPDLDVCVYRLVGFGAPPLRLRKTGIVIQGQDVGLVGFPMGNRLQGPVIRPFVTKSIVAGVYEGEDRSKIKGPKIAIAESVAGGFSGGPIYSARDGEVLGMLSSTMMEGGQWPAGISLGIVSTTIWGLVAQAQGSSARAIQAALKPTEKPSRAGAE